MVEGYANHFYYHSRCSFDIHHCLDGKKEQEVRKCCHSAYQTLAQNKLCKKFSVCKGGNKNRKSEFENPDGFDVRFVGTSPGQKYTKTPFY